MVDAPVPLTLEGKFFEETFFFLKDRVQQCQTHESSPSTMEGRYDTNLVSNEGLLLL
jgi:hypothetical protein